MRIDFLNDNDDSERDDEQCPHKTCNCEKQYTSAYFEDVCSYVYSASMKTLKISYNGFAPPREKN